MAADFTSTFTLDAQVQNVDDSIKKLERLDDLVAKLNGKTITISGTDNLSKIAESINNVSNSLKQITKSDNTIKIKTNLDENTQKLFAGSSSTLTKESKSIGKQIGSNIQKGLSESVKQNSRQNALRPMIDAEKIKLSQAEKELAATQKKAQERFRKRVQNYQQEVTNYENLPTDQKKTRIKTLHARSSELYADWANSGDMQQYIGSLEEFKNIPQLVNQAQKYMQVYYDYMDSNEKKLGSIKNVKGLSTDNILRAHGGVVKKMNGEEMRGLKRNFAEYKKQYNEAQKILEDLNQITTKPLDQLANDQVVTQLHQNLQKDRTRVNDEHVRITQNNVSSSVLDLGRQMDALRTFGSYMHSITDEKGMLPENVDPNSFFENLIAESNSFADNIPKFIASLRKVDFEGLQKAFPMDLERADPEQYAESLTKGLLSLYDIRNAFKNVGKFKANDVSQMQTMMKSAASEVRSAEEMIQALKKTDELGEKLYTENKNLNLSQVQNKFRKSHGFSVTEADSMLSALKSIKDNVYKEETYTDLNTDNIGDSWFEKLQAISNINPDQRISFSLSFEPDLDSIADKLRAITTPEYKIQITADIAETIKSVESLTEELNSTVNTVTERYKKESAQYTPQKKKSKETIDSSWFAKGTKSLSVEEIGNFVAEPSKYKFDPDANLTDLAERLNEIFKKPSSLRDFPIYQEKYNATESLTNDIIDHVVNQWKSGDLDAFAGSILTLRDKKLFHGVTNQISANKKNYEQDKYKKMVAALLSSNTQEGYINNWKSAEGSLYQFNSEFFDKLLSGGMSNKNEVKAGKQAFKDLFETRYKESGMNIEKINRNFKNRETSIINALYKNAKAQLDRVDPKRQEASAEAIAAENATTLEQIVTNAKGKVANINPQELTLSLTFDTSGFDSAISKIKAGLEALRQDLLGHPVDITFTGGESDKNVQKKVTAKGKSPKSKSNAVSVVDGKPSQTAINKKTEDDKLVSQQNKLDKNTDLLTKKQVQIAKYQSDLDAQKQKLLDVDRNKTIAAQISKEFKGAFNTIANQANYEDGLLKDSPNRKRDYSKIQAIFDFFDKNPDIEKNVKQTTAMRKSIDATKASGREIDQTQYDKTSERLEKIISKIDNKENNVDDYLAKDPKYAETLKKLTKAQELANDYQTNIDKAKAEIEKIQSKSVKKETKEEPKETVTEEKPERTEAQKKAIADVIARMNEIGAGKKQETPKVEESPAPSSAPENSPKISKPVEAQVNINASAESVTSLVNQIKTALEGIDQNIKINIDPAGIDTAKEAINGLITLINTVKDTSINLKISEESLTNIKASLDNLQQLTNPPAVTQNVETNEVAQSPHTLKISVDTQSAQQIIENIKTEIKNIDAQIKISAIDEATTTIKAIGTELDALKNKASGLQTFMSDNLGNSFGEGLQGKIDGINFDSVKEKVTALNTSIQEGLISSVNDLSDSLNGLGTVKQSADIDPMNKALLKGVNDIQDFDLYALSSEAQLTRQLYDKKHIDKSLRQNYTESFNNLLKTLYKDHYLNDNKINDDEGWLLPINDIFSKINFNEILDPDSDLFYSYEMPNVRALASFYRSANETIQEQIVNALTKMPLDKNGKTESQDRTYKSAIGTLQNNSTKSHTSIKEIYKSLLSNIANSNVDEYGDEYTDRLVQSKKEGLESLFKTEQYLAFRDEKDKAKGKTSQYNYFKKDTPITIRDLISPRYYDEQEEVVNEPQNVEVVNPTLSGISIQTDEAKAKIDELKQALDSLKTDVQSDVQGEISSIKFDSVLTQVETVKTTLNDITTQFKSDIQNAINSIDFKTISNQYTSAVNESMKGLKTSMTDIFNLSPNMKTDGDVKSVLTSESTDTENQIAINSAVMKALSQDVDSVNLKVKELSASLNSIGDGLKEKFQSGLDSINFSNVTTQIDTLKNSIDTGLISSVDSLSNALNGLSTTKRSTNNESIESSLSEKVEDIQDTSLNNLVEQNVRRRQSIDKRQITKALRQDFTGAFDDLLVGLSNNGYFSKIDSGTYLESVDDLFGNLDFNEILAPDGPLEYLQESGAIQALSKFYASANNTVQDQILSALARSPLNDNGSIFERTRDYTDAFDEINSNFRFGIPRKKIVYRSLLSNLAKNFNADYDSKKFKQSLSSNQNFLENLFSTEPFIDSRDYEDWSQAGKAKYNYFEEKKAVPVKDLIPANTNSKSQEVVNESVATAEAVNPTVAGISAQIDEATTKVDALAQSLKNLNNETSSNINLGLENIDFSAISSRLSSELNSAFENVSLESFAAKFNTSINTPVDTFKKTAAELFGSPANVTDSEQGFAFNLPKSYTPKTEFLDNIFSNEEGVNLRNLQHFIDEANQTNPKYIAALADLYDIDLNKTVKNSMALKSVLGKSGQADNAILDRLFKSGFDPISDAGDEFEEDFLTKVTESSETKMRYLRQYLDAVDGIATKLPANSIDYRDMDQRYAAFNKSLLPKDYVNSQYKQLSLIDIQPTATQANQGSFIAQIDQSFSALQERMETLKTSVTSFGETFATEIQGKIDSISVEKLQTSFKNALSTSLSTENILPEKELANYTSRLKQSLDNVQIDGLQTRLEEMIKNAFQVQNILPEDQWQTLAETARTKIDDAFGMTQNTQLYRQIDSARGDYSELEKAFSAQMPNVDSAKSSINRVLTSALTRSLSNAVSTAQDYITKTDNLTNVDESDRAFKSVAKAQALLANFKSNSVLAKYANGVPDLDEVYEKLNVFSQQNDKFRENLNKESKGLVDNNLLNRIQSWETGNYDKFSEMISGNQRLSAMFQKYTNENDSLNAIEDSKASAQENIKALESQLISSSSNPSFARMFTESLKTELGAVSFGEVFNAGQFAGAGNAFTEALKNATSQLDLSSIGETLHTSIANAISAKDLVPIDKIKESITQAFADVDKVMKSHQDNSGKVQAQEALKGVNELLSVQSQRVSEARQNLYKEIVPQDYVDEYSRTIDTLLNPANYNSKGGVRATAKEEMYQSIAQLKYAVENEDILSGVIDMNAGKALLNRLQKRSKTKGVFSDEEFAKTYSDYVKSASAKNINAIKRGSYNSFVSGNDAAKQSLNEYKSQLDEFKKLSKEQETLNNDIQNADNVWYEQGKQAAAMIEKGLESADLEAILSAKGYGQVGSAIAKAIEDSVRTVDIASVIAGNNSFETIGMTIAKSIEAGLQTLQIPVNEIVRNSLSRGSEGIQQAVLASNQFQQAMREQTGSADTSAFIVPASTIAQGVTGSAEGVNTIGGFEFHKQVQGVVDPAAVLTSLGFDKNFSTETLNVLASNFNPNDLNNPVTKLVNTIGRLNILEDKNLMPQEPITSNYQQLPRGIAVNNWRAEAYEQANQLAQIISDDSGDLDEEERQIVETNRKTLNKKMGYLARDVNKAFDNAASNAEGYIGSVTRTDGGVIAGNKDAVGSLVKDMLAQQLGIKDLDIKDVVSIDNKDFAKVVATYAHDGQEVQQTYRVRDYVDTSGVPMTSISRVSTKSSSLIAADKLEDRAAFVTKIDDTIRQINDLEDIRKFPQIDIVDKKTGSTINRSDYINGYKSQLMNEYYNYKDLVDSGATTNKIYEAQQSLNGIISNIATISAEQQKGLHKNFRGYNQTLPIGDGIDNVTSLQGQVAQWIQKTYGNEISKLAFGKNAVSTQSGSRDLEASWMIGDKTYRQKFRFQEFQSNGQKQMAMQLLKGINGFEGSQQDFISQVNAFRDALVKQSNISNTLRSNGVGGLARFNNLQAFEEQFNNGKISQVDAANKPIIKDYAEISGIVESLRSRVTQNSQYIAELDGLTDQAVQQCQQIIDAASKSGTFKGLTFKEASLDGLGHNVVAMREKISEDAARGMLDQVVGSTGKLFDLQNTPAASKVYKLNKQELSRSQYLEETIFKPLRDVQYKFANNNFASGQDLEDTLNRIVQIRDAADQFVLKERQSVAGSNAAGEYKGVLDGAVVDLNNAKEAQGAIRSYISQVNDTLDPKDRMTDFTFTGKKGGAYNVSFRQNGVEKRTRFNIRNFTDETGATRSALYQTPNSEIDTKNPLNRWFTTIGGKIRSISQYMTGMMMVSRMFNEIRSGFSFVATLDSSMTNIGMTMNATSDALRELSQQAVKTGVDLKTDASNVLEAVTIYANANETTESILERAKPTIMLANASKMSASDASNVLQAVGNQFTGMEGNELQVVNSYEKISANLAMDFASGIEGMSAAVQNAGSIANESGLSFELFASMVGKVAEQTRLDGGTVGTQMRNIMARISRSKDADDDVSAADRSNAAKAYKEVAGIDLYNSYGEYQDLSKTFDQLSKSWDSLTDAQKNYISEESAGTRGINVFRSMMDNYAAIQNLATDALSDPDFYKGVQAKWENSLEGQLQGIKANKQNMWTMLLDSGTATGVVSIGNALFEAFNSLLGAVNNVSQSFGNLFAVFGPNVKNSVGSLGTVGFSGLLVTGIYQTLKDYLLQTRNANSDNGIRPSFTKAASFGFAPLVSFGRGAKHVGSDIVDIITNSVHTRAARETDPEVTSGMITAGTLLGKTKWKEIKDTARSMYVAGKTARQAGKAFDRVEALGDATGLSRGFGNVAGFVGNHPYLTGALGAGVLAAIGVAIGKAISEAPAKTKEEAETARNEYNASLQKTGQNRKFVDEVEKEYGELRKGVANQTNDNLSLNNEDYERFLELNGQVAERFPSLISGYDTLGNAILNVGNNLEYLNKAIEQQELDTATTALKDYETFFRSFKDDTAGVGPFGGFANDYYYGSVTDRLKILEKVMNASAEEVDDYMSHIIVGERNVNYKEASKPQQYLEKLGLRGTSGYYTKEGRATELATAQSGLREEYNNLQAGLIQSTSNVIEAMKAKASSISITDNAAKTIESSIWQNMNAIISGMSYETLYALTDNAENEEAPLEFVEHWIETLTRPATKSRIAEAMENIVNVQEGATVDQLKIIMSRDVERIMDVLDFKDEKKNNAFRETLYDAIGVDGAKETVKTYDELNAIMRTWDQNSRNRANDYIAQEYNDSYVEKERQRRAGSKQANYPINRIEILPDTYAEPERFDDLFAEVDFSGSELPEQVKKALLALNKVNKSLGGNSKALKEFIKDKNISDSNSLKNLASLLNKYKGDWDKLRKNWDFDTFNTSELTKALEALKDNLSTVSDTVTDTWEARDASHGSAGLDESEIKAVEAMYSSIEGYDYDALFEGTATGVHLNVKELDKLYGSYKKLETAKYENLIESYKQKWHEANEQILIAQESGNVFKMDKLLKYRAEIENAIRDSQELQSMFEGIINPVSEFKRAVNGGEEGDDYDYLYGQTEDIEQLYEYGLVNTNKFKSFAQLLTNEELTGASLDKIVSVYENGLANYKQIFTEDPREGITYTLQKLIEAGLATQTGDYSYDINADLQELAAAMGLSDAAATTLAKKLNDAGAELRFAEETDYFKEFRKQAEGAADSLSDVGKESGIDARQTDLKEINKELEKVAKAKEKANATKYEGWEKDVENLNTIESYYRSLKGSKIELGIDVNTEEGLAKIKRAEATINNILQGNLLAVEVNIDWSSTDINYYNEKIAEMQQNIDQLKGEEAVLKIGVEGYEEAYTIMASLIQQKHELNKSPLLKYDTDGVTDEQARNWLNAFQNVYAAMDKQSQLSELSESFQIKPEVQEVADDQLRAAWGSVRDAGGLAETLKLNYDIEIGSDDSIENVNKELTKLMDKFGTKENVIKFIAEQTGISPEEINQQLEMIPEETYTKVRIELEDADYTRGKIQSLLAQNEIDIPVGIDMSRVNYDALHGMSLDEIEVVLKYLADPTEIQSFEQQDRYLIAQYLLDSGAVDEYEKEGHDLDAFVNYLLGTEAHYNPEDYTRFVNYFLKKYGNPETEFKDVYRTAHYTVSTSPSSINTNPNQKMTHSPLADGTAHVNGSAFADGTPDTPKKKSLLSRIKETGRAFLKGDWGIKKGGTSLVGELGPELLVNLAWSKKFIELLGYPKDNLTTTQG